MKLKTLKTLKAISVNSSRVCVYEYFTGKAFKAFKAFSAHCRRPTAWTYRRGERLVSACRPDHAENAFRQAEGNGAMQNTLKAARGLWRAAV